MTPSSLHHRIIYLRTEGSLDNDLGDFIPMETPIMKESATSTVQINYNFLRFLKDLQDPITKPG